ncbi:hypothetical protein [Streptomyces sp. I05A-00742]|uniref:nSTAND1 domain-containing NTPase n=1 Tax=Streptomyces sp. I05A-00742 TaxID=2732853 RepID=UPI00148949CC|nr:hypothetical protein [Streptomyces sp. I05A-00742]
MPRQERPLDPGDSPLLRFAAGLRALRERAGGPTYRQLALRAHSSAASLSVAAGGRRLPSLAVTTAYVRACGGDVREWEARWHAVAAALADPRRPPYAGPAAYAPADADRFFGRERLVDALLVRLRRDRVVTVTGASGAGTTSLLQAGAVHRLTTAPRPPAVVTCVPGTDPVRDLTRGLAALRDPDGVLVVDQLERLFTHGTSATERTRFLDTLHAAPCRLILGVRTDAHDRWAGHPLFAGEPLSVPPLTPEEVSRAVAAPAARADCTVEESLLGVLVAGADRQPGALPLLSSALLAAWRHRDGNRLTLAGLRAAGGFEGTLARTAEAAWAELGEGQRRRARDILLRLAEPGDAGVPRPVDRRELGEGPDTAAVLERLAAARVVTLDHGRAALAHGAVLHGWPRLAAWTAEDPEGLRRRHRLTRAARAWQESGRDPAALWQGRRLAEERAAGSPAGHRPGPWERAFLDAGTAAERARHREDAACRARLRVQRCLIALLTALVVSLSAVVAATVPFAVR